MSFFESLLCLLNPRVQLRSLSGVVVRDWVGTWVQGLVRTYNEGLRNGSVWDRRRGWKRRLFWKVIQRIPWTKTKMEHTMYEWMGDEERNWHLRDSVLFPKGGETDIETEFDLDMKGVPLWVMCHRLSLLDVTPVLKHVSFIHVEDPSFRQDYRC